MSNSNNSVDVVEKQSISLFTIIEIIILAIGIIISIISTLKPLKYTTKYEWCFAFPILGAVLILIMIFIIKKKYTWIVGLCFIGVYMLFAGFGALVCEVNSSRLRAVESYKGKELIAVIDDTKYKWDGESVSYNPGELEYIDTSKYSNINVLVDGEEKNYGLYRATKTGDLFIEIDGRGTGIFLKIFKN